MSSNTARERVKELLLAHRGADNPITSREINDEIDEDTVGSFPETRMLVRDIIVEDGIPIASSNDGYYVVETEQELFEYIDNLDSRILSIADRKAAVLSAADDWSDRIDTSDDATRSKPRGFTPTLLGS
jgi:hypothetical protein